MTTWANLEELLSTLQEKFRNVRKLLDGPNREKSSESEEVTLRRKNEAVNSLKEIQIILEDALNRDTNHDEKFDYMLAFILLNIGIISIEKEDLQTGEEYLVRCVNALAGKEISNNGVLISLSAMNQLGIVWFQWTQPTKAESFLKRAETIYEEYTNMKDSMPVSMSALFGVIDRKELNPCEDLDKLHTLTLYYLAQIYSVQKNHSKSAEYCHMTLLRQLNNADLDHIDWALNAATLAQFFMEQMAFRQACHHLAAASYILKKYESSLGQPPKERSDDAASANWERYEHRSADVARCWAKYGILLMSTSRERLIELSENGEVQERSESSGSQCDLSEKNNVFDKMTFTCLEKNIESIVNLVTDRHLLDFNDARKVFLNVQHWLEKAQKYYNFESHASDYVQIIEDMSQAFKLLSFFEDNEERQAKMHKRRIDLLTSVVNELNPQYYQSECRQIWIELAETHSSILNIKLDRLRASNDRPTLHALSKINNLAQLAIKYYEKFLDSVKEPVKSPGLIKFADDMARPALYAYFHIGTLYNKIITSDKQVQLKNVKKSIEAYKFFIDYCESNKDLAKFMNQELNVCKELVDLLPLKVNKLEQAILAM